MFILIVIAGVTTGVVQWRRVKRNPQKYKGQNHSIPIIDPGSHNNDSSSDGGGGNAN